MAYLPDEYWPKAGTSANYFEHRYITAAKLIKLLATFPPDSILVVNQVGNLSLLDSAASLKQIGYIEIGAEEATTQEPH